MKAVYYCCLLLIAMLAASRMGHAQSSEPQEETLRFGYFGDVHIYRATAQPKHVVLFVSGDGGWNLGVIDMARALTGLDALVAGIDITTYLKHLQSTREACSYPAADFESLSQFLQKHYGLADYIAPVLVGYSSGATLVYATLAQAPPNTFRGGMSLGFCPDLPVSKPLCRGSGLKFTTGPRGKGYSFLPAPDLQTPWIAFQGDMDQVCAPTTTAQFVAQTGQAHLVSLPGVGHGFSVQRHWMPQFKHSFSQLTSGTSPPAPPRPTELGNLPLIEIPVAQPDKTFAVIVSGDGGWAGIDKSLAKGLATDGIPSVGLDSLHYFWTRRTAEGMGHDLADILHHYLETWRMDRVLLIGYSRGADVLPFMVNRLPADLRERVALVVLLGAEHRVDFEFHVTDWLPGSRQQASHQVKPEVERLAGYKVLCIYGQDESAPLCPDLDPAHVTSKKMPGGHHFGGDYQELADLILHEVRR